MSKVLVIALTLLISCSFVRAGQMTYTPTTGGKPVTEKSVRIPLRILGPLYRAQSSVATPRAIATISRRSFGSPRLTDAPPYRVA
jgi:hypothetical protein